MSSIIEDARREGYGLPFAGTAVWLIAALTSLWLVRPPAPAAEDSPSVEASGSRARAVLERIAREDDGRLSDPRPVGSEANGRCRARILEELRRLGLEPEVQQVFGAHHRQRAMGTVRNVVAVLPGAGGRGSGERDAILCMAHYDSVAAGPGIGDDLAGVASWLEVARALQSGPALTRDVILLFEDGEEQGLLGAELFAQLHPLSRRVGAVVNLEGRGVSGPSRMFETGADNAWVVEAWARHATSPSASSLSVEIYRRMPNDTDYTVWRERGVQGLNFAFIGGVTAYHTPLDDLENLSTRSLQHHCTNGLDAVRALDGAQFPGELDVHGELVQAGGDAVFFDVAGSFLVHMGFTEGRVFAGLALVLALLVTGLLARRPDTRIGRIFLAAALLPLGLVVSWVAAHWMRLLLLLMGMAPVPHQAHADILTASCVLAALFGFALALIPMGRMIHPAEGLGGALLLLGLMSAGVGFAAVGAVHLFAAPALVTAVTLVAVLAFRPSLRTIAMASQLGLASATMLWTPLHAAVIDAFGTAPGPLLPLGPGLPVPVVVAPLLVPFLLLAPCLLRAPGALRAKSTALISLGALVLAFITCALSIHLGQFTSAAPAPVNIRVLTDSTRPGSSVELEPWGEGVKRFEQGVGPRGMPDGEVGRYLESPGRVDILERGVQQDGRAFVRVRVVPRDGCGELGLRITRKVDVTVDGVPVPASMFRILGPDPGGHELQLVSAPDVEPEISMVETRFGLEHGAVRSAVEPWLRARPEDTVPSRSGDRSEVWTTHSLGGGEGR